MTFKQFAMQPVETITVDTPTVGCDGGGGALGHPLVYLTLTNGTVTCPYCGRVYKTKDGKSGGHGH